MNKFFKIVIVIIVLCMLNFGFYKLFISPDVDNSKLTLTVSYFDHITSAAVCENHFNPETASFCEIFTSELKTESFTHSEASMGNNLAVTIIIGDIEDIFVVTFIEETNPGISGFFHKTNYLIDTIE